MSNLVVLTRGKSFHVDDTGLYMLVHTVEMANRQIEYGQYIVEKIEKKDLPYKDWAVSLFYCLDDIRINLGDMPSLTGFKKAQATI